VDDNDEYSAGWKFHEWELKGVPIRIEIGPKDIEKKEVVLVRRDTGKKETIKEKNLDKEIGKLLDDIQNSLFNKAKKFLDSSIVKVNNWDKFIKVIKDKKIAYCQFCGEVECEDWIKDKTGGATSRCIPFKQEKVTGKCIHCGKKSKYWIYFSKSY